MNYKCGGIVIRVTSFVRMRDDDSWLKFREQFAQAHRRLAELQRRFLVADPQRETLRRIDPRKLPRRFQFLAPRRGVFGNRSESVIRGIVPIGRRPVRDVQKPARA